MMYLYLEDIQKKREKLTMLRRNWDIEQKKLEKKWEDELLSSGKKKPQVFLQIYLI